MRNIENWQHCLLCARPNFISVHLNCTAVRNPVGRSTKVVDLACAEKDVILAVMAYCPTFEDGVYRVRLLSRIEEGWFYHSILNIMQYATSRFHFIT